MWMPRAGKSTQISMLSEYYKNTWQTCEIITDRVINQELSFVSKSLWLEYNMLYVNKILEKMLYHMNENVDVIIVDRWVIDMIPWIDVELELDHISLSDANILREYCQSIWNKYVTKALLFMVEPELALERHAKTIEWQKKKVSYSMNMNYLPRLYNTYKKLKHEKI